MAPRVLSDAELEALTSWPSEVAHSDLVEYFTLDVDDLRWVRSHRGAASRLGLAVQLCGLRFLGFVPADLTTTPAEVTGRLAERVGVAPLALARYVGEVDGRLPAFTSPRSSSGPAGATAGPTNASGWPTGSCPAPWSTTTPRCCSPSRSSTSGPSASSARGWTGSCGRWVKPGPLRTRRSTGGCGRSTLRRAVPSSTP